MTAKKMIFEWNRNTIRWFKAASGFTGFHRGLAQHLRPYLTKADTFIDVGCGLGLLSQELAPSVRHVHCIDIDEAAIASLQEDIREKNIDNVNATREDFYSDALLSHKWDVVLMSFFGNLDADIPRGLRICDKRLIAISHGEKQDRNGSLHSDVEARPTSNLTRAFLEQAGLSFKAFDLTLPFGQPLTSRADAEAYLSRYTDMTGMTAVSDMDLDAILEKTERQDYPFYLPKDKKIGVFIINQG